MSSVDELARSLLYEGYALYPYTPGATKNATPTPFGIVYPPAYAAGSGSTFDHLRVETLLEAPDDIPLVAELLFLQPSGRGHQATERRVRLGPASPAGLVEAPWERPFSEDGLEAGLSLGVEAREGGRWLVRFSVRNETAVDAEGMDRAGALRSSLVSTHALLRAPGGRFVSPLEARGCEHVNTWPVLAGEADDVILAAAIVLPDHPGVAARSRGDLYDNTEIEEALLLHVHTLSDTERRAIEQGDPRVREMVERALQTSPDDLLDLHGVFGPTGPTPSGPPNNPGEAEVVVDGRRFRRGDTLVLRLARSRDPYDHMLDGRTATVERIYRDTDDQVCFAVTIDGDPMQEIMRDSGRYHFFFPEDVEVVGGCPS